MKKTKVALLIRIVFLFWLIVSIALLGTTISTFLPLSDWRRDHERAVPLLKLTSTVSTAQVRRARPPLNLKDLQRP
jgi:hypothetical protein